MEIPKISIVMPTYNRASLLSRSIKSVFQQSFSAWELIVIDDASTDDTPAVLQAFAAQDPRVRVVRNEKNEYRRFGIANTLNKGLGLARGKYIARLDDDDYWVDPCKLEKQAAFLDAHQDCVVVGGGAIVINEEGEEQFRYFKKETDAEIRKTALFANPFTHTAVLFRADVALAVERYQGMHIEDWDLWLRMGECGTFYNFQEYFTGYTMAPASYSFRDQRPLSREVLKLIWRNRRKYPEFLKALLLNSLQYCYAYFPIPMALRVRLHATLAKAKRKAF